MASNDGLANTVQTFCTELRERDARQDQAFADRWAQHDREITALKARATARGLAPSLGVGVAGGSGAVAIIYGALEVVKRLLA